MCKQREQVYGCLRGDMSDIPVGMNKARVRGISWQTTPSTVRQKSMAGHFFKDKTQDLYCMFKRIHTVDSAAINDEVPPLSENKRLFLIRHILFFINVLNKKMIKCSFQMYLRKGVTVARLTYGSVKMVNKQVKQGE